MSLSLSDRMDFMYNRGLELMQEHEYDIKREWQWVVEQYNRNDIKFAPSIEKIVKTFTDYFFKEIPLNDCLTKLPSSFHSNHYIMTVLENIVHKVIQENRKRTNQDHFAIHHLFTKLSEEILINQHHESIELKMFLEHMAKSNQLPIELICIVEKIDDTYISTNLFTKDSTTFSPNSERLEATSIYELTEQLYKALEQTNKQDFSIIPIPYDNFTLFVCLPKADVQTIIPFINFTLKVFQDHKQILKRTKQSQQWKDAVIMFNEKVIGSQTYSEAIQNISRGFAEFLPFERSALFSYSKNDHTGFGLYGHHLDTEAIKSITENVQNLPIIHKQLKLLQYYGRKLKYIQPLYIPNAKGIFPDQYIEQFQLHSVVIVPIYLSSNLKLLGAAILDQGPNRYFKIDKETYFALIKFGQSAGEVLAKYNREQDKKNEWQLSPRELEVLQLLSEGASTFEAAIDMNLSEYTVRDYVSSIMQKMNVKNRTEAVAKAIREGLI